MQGKYEFKSPNEPIATLYSSTKTIEARMVNILLQTCIKQFFNCIFLYVSNSDSWIQHFNYLYVTAIATPEESIPPFSFEAYTAT